MTIKKKKKKELLKKHTHLIILSHPTQTHCLTQSIITK